MQASNIRALYYITHIDNLPAILTTGILSHERITVENVRYTPIYNVDIVNERRNTYTPAGKSLWHYANLFFQPRNAMLDSLVNPRYPQNYGTRRNLAVLGVASTVLQEQGVFITDGIAANKRTRFYNLSAGLRVLHANLNILQSPLWISWLDDPELRRKLMAECLVPNQVNPKDIQQFIVVDQSIANLLQNRLSFFNFRKCVIATDRGSNIFTPFPKG
jgi:hypothetical protein